MKVRLDAVLTRFRATPGAGVQSASEYFFFISYAEMSSYFPLLCSTYLFSFLLPLLAIVHVGSTASGLAAHALGINIIIIFTIISCRNVVSLTNSFGHIVSAKPSCLDIGYGDGIVSPKFGSVISSAVQFNECLLSYHLPNEKMFTLTI